MSFFVNNQSNNRNIIEVEGVYPSLTHYTRTVPAVQGTIFSNRKMRSNELTSIQKFSVCLVLLLLLLHWYWSIKQGIVIKHIFTFKIKKLPATTSTYQTNKRFSFATCRSVCVYTHNIYPYTLNAIEHMYSRSAINKNDNIMIDCKKFLGCNVVQQVCVLRLLRRRKQK